ncbi:MAG: TonB-dependent receptor [Thiobacillus sp.]
MGGALVLSSALAPVSTARAAVTESAFLDELPVVLSVSRMSQPQNEAPAAVTIIDQEMIRASGFRDIPDLLRLVPGFSVAYTRDNTWAAGYHGLADAFSRRLQVLVDGRSIYSATYGLVNWVELPLAIDDIERIEVVRGPNAATYGANAFFSVINIVTKDPSQVPGGFASVQYGEQGMAGATLRYGGGGEDLSYRLTFSAQNRDRFETDIVDAGVPGKLFEEGRTYLLNGRMTYRLSAIDELSAQFGVSVADLQSGRLLSPPTPIHFLEPRQQDTDTRYVQARFRRALNADDEWSLQLYHTWSDLKAPARVPSDWLGLPAGATVVGDTDAIQSRTNIEFQAGSRLSPELRMIWGAEARHERVQAPLYFGDDTARTGTLGRAFANLEWRARPDLLVHGGAMLEHHYFTGFDVSPRLAVNYDLAPGHTLRLNVSQAYRTPTFLEQEGYYVYRTTTGAIVDVVGRAIYDLKPERIRSHEMAYVGFFKSLMLQMDAKLFYDKVDDFITTEHVAGELNPLNSGGFEVRGGEVQLNWQPTSALRLTAQYARVHIDSSAILHAIDDDVQPSAPRDSFSLLARYNLGGGWMASGGLYHSGRLTWLGDGDPTPAFTRVDARLARQWKWQGHDVEAAIVGQNLGRDYSEFRPENRFSRRVYGSLGLQW